MCLKYVTFRSAVNESHRRDLQMVRLYYFPRFRSLHGARSRLAIHLRDRVTADTRAVGEETMTEQPW